MHPRSARKAAIDFFPTLVLTTILADQLANESEER